MNILHLCAADENSGAGSAALMTHQVLLSKNINSRILFIKSNSNEKNNYSFDNISLYTKIKRLLNTFLDRSLLFFYPKRSISIFSPGIFGLNLKYHNLIKWSDIVHIHWANHGFVDIAEISRWNKKVIWTMRDMWVFTGGCHYSYECNKYLETCTRCPALNSNSKLDLSYYSFNRKFNNFNKSKIIWISISKWLKEKAENSRILNSKEIQVIPSGYDQRHFFQIPKQFSRNYLGIKSKGTIILIGAQNISDAYKGYKYSLELFKYLNEDDLILVFGSHIINEKNIKAQVINFGFVTNKEILNIIYNSADLFVGTSIMEAFGKTYAEAQACGLPVLCFSGTGASEIIEHKKSGYVAEHSNINDLINGYNFIKQNIFDRNYISYRAFKSYAIDSVANKYIDLYNLYIND